MTLTSHLSCAKNQCENKKPRLVLAKERGKRTHLNLEINFAVSGFYWLFVVIFGKASGFFFF